MSVDWSLLGPPVDVGASFRAGWEHGQAQRERHDLRRALATLQDDPTDARSRRVLAALDPQSLNALDEATYRRGERGRADRFRSAFSDMILSGGGAPQRNALALPAPSEPAVSAPVPPRQGAGGLPAPNALAPTSALAPAPQALPGAPVPQAGLPAPVESGPSPYERMVRADPEGALEARGKQVKLSADQIELYDKLTDFGLELISSVADQASYDAAKDRARALYAQHGVDSSGIDALPAEYSPEIVMQIRAQSMQTKDLLASMRAERRLGWDIEDDVADNERADTEADRRESYRRDALRVRESEGAANRSSRAREGRLNRGERRDAAERKEQMRVPAGTIIETENGSQKILKGGRWVPYDG